MKKLDITGKRFGKLVAIEKTKKPDRVKESSATYWLCQCDCGSVKKVRIDHLNNGKTRSCGCLKKDVRFEDITGKKFNRWTVLDHGGKDKYGKTVWECVCDCGTKRLITGTSLKRGDTKSCGCLRREVISQYEDLTGITLCEDCHKKVHRGEGNGSK